MDDTLKKDIIKLGNDIIRETILLFRSMERNSYCMRNDEKKYLRRYLLYSSFHPYNYCMESTVKFIILDCIHNLPELLTSIEYDIFEKRNYLIEDKYFLKQANELEKFYTENKAKMYQSFSGDIEHYITRTCAQFSKFSDMLEEYRHVKDVNTTYENISQDNYV